MNLEVIASQAQSCTDKPALVLSFLVEVTNRLVQSFGEKLKMKAVFGWIVKMDSERIDLCPSCYAVRPQP